VSGLRVPAPTPPVLPEDTLLVIRPVHGPDVVVEVLALDVVAGSILAVIARDAFAGTVRTVIQGDTVRGSTDEGGEREEGGDGGNYEMHGGQVDFGLSDLCLCVCSVLKLLSGMAKFLL
jgi:hypothetical protein